MLNMLYFMVIMMIAFAGLTLTDMSHEMVELNYFLMKGAVNLSLLLLCTYVIGVVCGSLSSLVQTQKRVKYSQVSAYLIRDDLIRV